jgi:uncharacterized protein YgiM (DUF1202 family)
MEDTMRTIGFALASLLLPVLILSGMARHGALAATGDTLVVTGGRVNVRDGPSTDTKVRMKVGRDQLVTEVERQGDWVRVEIPGTNGASGWIHSSLLAVPSAEQLARAHQRTGTSPRAGSPEVKPPAMQPAPAKPQASSSSSSDASTGSSSSAAAAAVADSSGAMATSKSRSRAGGAPTPAAGPVEAADAAELARFRDSVDYLNSRSSSIAGVDLFGDVETAGEGVVRVGATDAWASVPPGSQQSYANTLVDRWAAARGYSGPATVQIVGPDGKVLLESTKR